MLKELQFSIYGRDLFSFYPKSNIWGDPGLIRGPGFRDPVDRQVNIASQGSQDFNTIGGSSESTALPGTVLFGFTVSAIF